GGAAVHALVAGAVAHHDAAAVGARRRVGLIDEGLANAAVLAVAQTGYRSHRYSRQRRVRCFGFCRQRFLRLDNPDLALCFLVEELRRHPAEQVIDDRLGVRNLRVLGEARGLEAHVREFVHQELQRNAVLERERNRGRKRVHQARDRRALLGHRDKYFTRGAVLVHADGDITFVAGDIEFVGDRFALVGQFAPLHAIVGRRDRRHCVYRFLYFLPARVERLHALGSVAVNRDRLEAELPRADVSLGDFVHGRFRGHIDGLGNRAGDKRLHRTHHLEVPVVMNRAGAGARLEGAIEDGEMRVGELRRTFDSLVLVEVFDDFLDFLRVVDKALERARDGVVDDLQHPAADQLFVLDERDVGLDAGGVAIHHEGDGAGRRDDGGLRIAIAGATAELKRVVP